MGQETSSPHHVERPPDPSLSEAARQKTHRAHVAETQSETASHVQGHGDTKNTWHYSAAPPGHTSKCPWAPQGS